MSKKITLENVDSSELPEIPVIGEVKQIRFTQDMELVSTLADSDLFMVQVGADLEARPNTITFDLIIKNLSGPIEEGSKKFVTGDEMFKVIGDITLLDTWDNTNIVSSLNATYVNVRRIEEELRREINRSTEKDELHDSQIANLRQDLTSTNELLNQEINRSVAKDKEHDELLAGLRDDVDSTSDKLDAEIDRSTAKDAEHDTLLKGLRVDVNANKSAIDSEVARSTARDEAHDTAIAKNASDITTEVNRAKAEEAKIRQEMQTADTNLQNAITAETERAKGVEEDLQQQITDLSGSTDDRLDALEALSHEQNTDTGTTSKTFVIDSGNTGAMLKAEGGGLSTRTKGDAGYANFTVQNLVIKGDVTQEGDTFITQAERVEVRDNMILINEGETGAGVTAGFAGIEVDRGTEQNFMFGFNESDGMFKIGKEGNMFDVALRQPVGEMTDGMFASWDASTKTFKTTNLIPPTLQLYFGVPEVSVKYVSDNNGSLQFVTNDKSWSAYTTVGSTKFTSSENRFRFYGEMNISDGVLKCDVNSFRIQVASAHNLVISGSGSTLSTPLTANSFFRSSDNAEVLYATDITTLTDGMFLSWDEDNKKVVTTNMVPLGSKLYLGNINTYIEYDNIGSGNISLSTSNGYFKVGTIASTYTTFLTNSAKGFLFNGNVEVYNGIINSRNDSITIGTSSGNGASKLHVGSDDSYITTPFSAVTFHRSTDDSEVLYQADLKSVLTGKETNYAPTVKAVSDAIDAVNTGTTESLKNYLKLSGGTMTGSIRIVNAGSSSTLTGILNNDGTKALLFTFLKGSENRWGVGSKEDVGVLRSNVSDLIHLVNNNGTINEYSIYDKRNLPDPATKSGNNAFTGTNSFVGGKFSVAGSEAEVYVSAVGNLVTRSTYGTTGWIRSIEFSDNDVVVARFGVKAITTNNVPTTNFVGILVGDGTVNDSQYKFTLNSIEVPSVFSLSTTNGVSKILSVSSGRMKFGDYQCECYLESKDVDLIHNKNNVAYKIWDASNLPTPASTSDIPDVSDMARRSEANTFTASNTFTAGQFNVSAFEIDANNNIFVNISQASGWARELVFINNSSAANSVRYGVSGSTNVTNYAYIGIGDVDYSTAQYKFTPNRLVVPASWSLIDESTAGEIILFGSENQYFGRNRGTTYIRSGNTDLYHTKVSTNYKILDESNYSQYLPTTSKWTYGFVGLTISEGLDLNTVLQGADKPKTIYNYTGRHYLLNAPSGVEYGSVWQLWNSLQSDAQSLNPQLFFDINHDVENGTRYMYFRTSNNKGFGDSSNWKRVITADEKPAGYVLDSTNYPALKSLETGTSLTWLRAPEGGFIPFSHATFVDGGSGQIGTSDWGFRYAYIHNIYSNKYNFGTGGVDFRLDTNNKIAATISGSAQGIEIGDLLVSSNYGADSAKVPTNGIFSSGRIQSNDSMLVGYTRNTTGGQLGYGLYYAGTSWIGLGSEYSSGAMILYKSVNPNIGSSGYNVPVAGTVIPTYLKLMDGTVKLGVGANKAYTAGEAVTMTEHTLATLDAVNTKLGSYLPLTGGTVGQLVVSAAGSNPMIVNNSDTGGTDVFQIFRVKGANKFLLGWSESGGGAFIQRSDNNRAMILKSDGLYTGGNLGSTVRVATLTDLGGYLPLTGGTMTGALRINSGGSEPLIINNSASSAGESYIVPQTQGTTRGAMGWNASLGMFLQDSRGYTFSMKADGVYFGVSSSSLTKLLTSADLSSYATQSWSTGQFAPLATYTTTSNYPTIINIGNEYILTSNQASCVVNYRTPSGTVIPSSWYWRAGSSTSYANAYFGNLYMSEKLVATQEWVSGRGYLTSVPSTYATQSWVTSQGYLTSITKSMVTTALGYTPPTSDTTYNAATSTVYGLVKIGATGLASKNYAVQLNSSGQMYVAVPWTDTNTTYSAATSSTYGLVKIGATGLASKNYAVQLNSSGQMYVAVPWTDTDTNTHYTTRLYVGASGTAANAAATSPYLKVTDDNTYRNQVRFVGAGATTVTSDSSGNITITSTNTTYGVATESSSGLMAPGQVVRLNQAVQREDTSVCVETIAVVDTIPAASSQIKNTLYLKFA